jgi:peptidoglycan/xylan/chitin deacetylase (PgdA/CDA1 family)
MTALVNLCFHGIGRPARETEPGEDAYWIETDLYHRVLDLVAEDPRVRISFDDGNLSDVAIGLPGLVERGLRATFFVLAGRLGQPGSLAEDDVRDLVASGMRIGSHGMDHRPWRQLDRAALDRETVEARARLAAVAGRPIEEAALPLGRYDRRLLGRVRRLGYTRLHTSDRTWARADAWLQPRFSLRSGDTVESVRRDVLTPASRVHRARRAAVIAAKRLR